MIGAVIAKKISKGDKMFSMKKDFKSNCWNLYVRLWKSLCPHLSLFHSYTKSFLNKSFMIKLVLESYCLQ